MVRAGYKQTELGVVPIDWEVKKVVDFASITTGNKNTQDRVADGKYPFIVRSDRVERINSWSFDGEAILTAGDGVGTGKIFHLMNGKFDYHQRVYNIHGFNDDAHGKYFYWQFSRNFYDRIMSMTAKSSVDSVRREMIADMLIAMPPPDEQKAIAEALSDVDALIESLEKVIAKKRAIKTATMQELLTGKTRLPGFGGEWEEKLIGSFTSLKAGGTPSTQIKEYWGGNILWMSSGELHLKFVNNVKGRITKRGLAESAATLLPAECVLIGLAGQGKTRGTVALNRIALTTNQSVAAIYPSRNHSSEFLFYNLDSRYEELRELSSGDGGRGGLNLTILSKLLVKMPSLNEQQAIAKVLLDIDNDLRLTDTKLNTAKGIKQGMMQELLTGRTRLV